MKKILSLFFTVLLLTTPLFAGSVDKMDKDQLKVLLDSENLVILDVRTGRDWSTSEFKIPNAVRIQGKDLSIVSKYSKDQTIVLYCA